MTYRPKQIEKDTATYVVSASNSENKYKADYICDGTTDSTKIQEAIDALPTGGGSVALLEGQYNIDTTIYIRSGVTLMGIGKASLLRLSSGANTHVISASNNSEDIAIKNLSIDGNHANNPGGDHLSGVYFPSSITLTRALINGVTMFNFSVGGVLCLANPGKYITISDSTFYDTQGGQLAIELVYARDSVITGNTISNPNDTHCQIEIQNSSDITCTNNVVSGSGFLIFSSSSCTLTGNVVHFPDDVGGWRGFQFSQHSDIYSQYNTIVSNTVYGAGISNGDGVGITVQANGGAKHNLIENNTFTYLHCAIHIRSAGGNNNGNSFSNNVIGTCGDSTIWIENTDLQVTKNHVSNITGVGVYFIGSCSGGKFEDNVIESCSILAINIEVGAAPPIFRFNTINGATQRLTPSLIGYNRYSDLFMDVIGISPTHIRNNEDLSAATPITFTIDAQTDVPRTLSGHFNSHGNITEYSITITGVDAKGNTVSETKTQANGWDWGTAIAFATITSIIMTERTGTGVGDTIDIGITDVLGLSNTIYKTTDIFKVKKNNANATVATAQVSKAYGTYDMSIIGLVGGDDFTIWYRSNLNIIS